MMTDPLATTFAMHGAREVMANGHGHIEQLRIFELEYRASEVLFSTDLEAYRDLLAGLVDDGVLGKPAIEVSS